MFIILIFMRLHDFARSSLIHLNLADDLERQRPKVVDLPPSVSVVFCLPSLTILSDPIHRYNINTPSTPGIAMGRPSDISEWERSRLMTPTNILQRLYDEIVSYLIDEQEQAAIRNKFNWHKNVSQDVKHWGQETFQCFLAQNSYPSSLPLLVEAGPILYSITVYLSRFPFDSAPSGDTPPINTYEELLRAIFWMLPGRAYLDEPRTTSDQRKILFQSLADTGGNSDISETEHNILDIISSSRM